MPRPKPFDDDWGDDEDDTISCPYCGHSVYEGSVRCPHCESYISEEDAPARKPWWLVLGVVVCLLIVYMWIRQGL